MRQKVAIARALIHEPKVVFLDEPTANLDPESSKTIRDFILKLKAQKRTVFLNTHNLDEAQRLCDRVGILKGKLLAVGPLESLRGSLWPRKTVIRLERASDPVVSAVKALGFKNVEVADGRLTVDIDDPSKENPGLIAGVAAAGGRIIYVTDLSPTLEDVYLRLVGN